MTHSKKCNFIISSDISRGFVGS